MTGCVPLVLPYLVIFTMLTHPSSAVHGVFITTFPDVNNIIQSVRACLVVAFICIFPAAVVKLQTEPASLVLCGTLPLGGGLKTIRETGSDKVPASIVFCFDSY